MEQKPNTSNQTPEAWNRNQRRIQPSLNEETQQSKALDIAFCHIHIISYQSNEIKGFRGRLRLPFGSFEALGQHFCEFFRGISSSASEEEKIFKLWKIYRVFAFETSQSLSLPIGFWIFFDEDESKRRKFLWFQNLKKKNFGWQLPCN